MRPDQTKKRKGMRFVSKVLTSQNPKNVYYVNKEQLERGYYMMALAGSLMIFYFLIS